MTEKKSINDDGRERKIEKKTFGGKEFDVIYVKGKPGKTKEEMDEMRASGNVNVDPAVSTFSFCAKLNPHSYEASPGVICDQDQACMLRDGTIIYCDIYRPANTTEKVPVIVSWACSANARPKAKTNGSSWAFRPGPFPPWPNSKAPTRASGATTAMPLPTSTRAASATLRAK